MQAIIKHKKNQARKRGRSIVQEQKQNRSKRKASQFKTKDVDSSKLFAVRINEKTTIMARVGQDPEAVRAKYFENQERYKQTSFRKDLSGN